MTEETIVLNSEDIYSLRTGEKIKKEGHKIILKDEKMLADDEREKMTKRLIDNDIKDIRQAMFEEDYEFLYHVLRGSGWTPYDHLSDEVLKREYDEREELREQN